MPDTSTIGAVLNLFGAGRNSGIKVPLTTDKTLSLADRAADAQKVGEALDTKADKARENFLIGRASGAAISVDDAFAAPMLGLHVYGKSTQDSTPTPTVPVPITSAGSGGTVTVRLTGENLLNPSLFQDGRYQNFDGTSANYAIATNDNYWITGLQPCVPGTAYHVNRVFAGGCFYDEARQPLGAISVGESFRTPTRCGYFCLNFEKSAVAFGAQVAVALGDAIYAPYPEQTLMLQTQNGLPGIPVASGGNYTDENGQQWVCDEVDLARGVYVQRITKIKVTSSLSWQTTGNAVDRYFAWFSGIYTSNVLCTHFSTTLGAETVGGAIANRNNLVGFAYGAKGATTLDDFKAFLNANDVYIWAALESPVETALSSAEIAAYKALITYAPTTVISVSGGAGITAVYQRDANIVVKALEDAIASMTTH